MWNGTQWVPNPSSVVAPMMVQQPMTTVIASPGAAEKSIAVAYLLWLFLGWIGVHHLYMGRGIGIWLISLITFQGIGFWWFFDLFLIPSSTRKVRTTTQQQVVVVH